jgi:hypothetical protein
VAKFKYLGMTATNRNYIHKEINSTLTSGNACYHSVQNLLSSRLLSKNIKDKVHETIILPVLLYECETWSSHIKGRTKTGVSVNSELQRGSSMKLNKTAQREALDDTAVMKSSRVRWVGHVACVGEMRNAYNISVGKPI